MKLTLSSRTIRKLLIAFAIIAGLVTPIGAHAVTGSEWRSSNIIDDALFYENGSMSAQDIQNFLNSKMPNCDTYGTKMYNGSQTRAQWAAANDKPAPPYVCLRDYSQDGRTAAQIIKSAADTYRISPKSILVTLQKEQTLVTDDWPWPNQYRSATGYGCPDTAPCDAQFYGFTNQVTKMAWQYRLYANKPGDYTRKPYQNNYTQYNPNESCGGTQVYHSNLATTGLYLYTPYQPNGPALNNLYGTGDGCSAYGNRNFWRLYNDWFGSTWFKPVNVIASPASVSWSPNRIDTFVKGADGALWQKWYDDNGGWRDWVWLGGDPDSSPSVSTRGEGKLNLFTVGSNGDLKHVWYNNGWRPWESLGKPSVNLVGFPATTSWSSSRIDVFAKGADGALWQKWYDDNGGWRGWTNLGGSDNSPPSVSSRGEGRINVFTVGGTTGDLKQLWFNNGWRPWESLGKPAKYIP